jgi:hypothetical protein
VVVGRRWGIAVRTVSDDEVQDMMKRIAVERIYQERVS